LEQDVSFLVGSTATITIHPQAYPIKNDPRDNWLFYAFQGFAILEQQTPRTLPISSFAAVGTGTGLDAIGATLKFRSLKHVVVSDVHAGVVETAIQNVERNIAKGITVQGFMGDVCVPLAQAQVLCDVIYSNLPNLPIYGGIDATQAWSFYNPPEDPTYHPLLCKYLLGLQLLFLQSSKDALQPGGFTLSMIGGRFPYFVFDLMAEHANCELTEVLCDLKRQSEALDTCQGYASRETDEIKFDYYKTEEAEAAVSILDMRTMKGRDLKFLLEPFKITATEAVKVVSQGGNVSHTVHMLKGCPKSCKK